MNDLLEKAIRGLECCSTYDDYSRKSCRECPYNEPDGKRSCKLHQMRVDALSLLKAQAPRLITKDDFANADAWGTIPAWIEYNPKIDGAEPGWQIVDVDILSSPFTKAWTSRPTDEQRKATPWTS